MQAGAVSNFCASRYYGQRVGAVAQLGERRVRNAKVGSSILLGSTNPRNEDAKPPIVPIHLRPILILTISLSGVGATPGFAQPYFEDISLSAGIDDPHNSTTFGVGQAWIDVERDGDLDLFVSNRNGPNHLYINEGDETFSEPAEFSNLAMPADVCNGVAIGDYDNDGWQDIYVTCAGPNRLFRNLNGAAFTEVGASAGVDNVHNGQVAAWADVNNDGWIDLYAVNYGPVGGGDPDRPEGAGTSRDAFYLNQGDGTFVDMGGELDATELNKPGLAVTFLDFDFDGDLDLYVINDRLFGNTLWRNDGPPSPECTITWCFTDVSVETGADRPVYGMGIAVGDYDLDGDEDLYFSSIAEQVLLQSQLAQGSTSYIDRSHESGLNFDAAGWATLFLDVDNDTWLDAYVATWNLSENDMDEFYVNQQDGTFLATGAASGIQTATFSEGAAMGDFNNDGLMDVAVTDPGTQIFLYKNVSSGAGNWVSFELHGNGPVNRDALGTTIVIQATDGKSYRRTLVSGGSRGAGNEVRLHFGLGSASIQSAIVYWPNGQQHEIPAQAGTINTIQYAPQGMLVRDGFE